MSELIYDPGPESARREHGLVPRATRETKMDKLRQRVTPTLGQGSKSWRRQLLIRTWRRDVPALHPLLGDPSKFKPSPGVKRMMRGRNRAKSQRMERDIAGLHQCPASKTYAVTIIDSVHSDVFAADAAAMKAKTRCERFLRYRFPGARVVLTPEVDAVPVGQIEATIFWDTRWKEQFAPNQIVWKVHFHGVVHVPAIRGQGWQDFDALRFPHAPQTIGRAMQTTPSGRRSYYAGAHQVRVKALHSVEAEVAAWNGYTDEFRDRMKEITKATAKGARHADVEGFLSYANKGHFRAPDPTEPFQVFSDWLWLAHRNLNDPRRTIRIGFRKPVQRYCDRCKVLHEREHECPSVLVKHDDWYASPQHGDHGSVAPECGDAQSGEEQSGNQRGSSTATDSVSDLFQCGIMVEYDKSLTRNISAHGLRWGCECDRLVDLIPDGPAYSIHDSIHDADSPIHKDCRVVTYWLPCQFGRVLKFGGHHRAQLRTRRSSCFRPHIDRPP